MASGRPDLTTRVRAFAKQARADFDAWEMLKSHEGVASCHALMFLQMACEKLCKAHLYHENQDVEDGIYETSHAVTSKHLNLIIERILKLKEPKGKTEQHRSISRDARKLSEEICYLSPAVAGDREQRPDNCEYPWRIREGVYCVPLHYVFPCEQMLKQPKYMNIIKLIKISIDLLCE
jgi:hypothetical protein